MRPRGGLIDENIVQVEIEKRIENCALSIAHSLLVALCNLELIAGVGSKVVDVGHGYSHLKKTDNKRLQKFKCTEPS